MCKKFIIESSLSELYSNTINNFDTPREKKSNRVQVNRTLFIPSPNNAILGVEATTRSLDKAYLTKIYFEDVEYTDDEGDSVVITAQDGQEYRIKQLDYVNTQVEVSCSCLDFHYRFAVWNHGDGSLYGNPPDPYVKQTDREPVNPNEVPGLCKHLMALVDELRRDNILN